MPASVKLDLSRALAPPLDNFNPVRWIVLPTEVRTIAAFKSWLRGREEWIGRLKTGGLHFLRSGGVVEDTGCLIGDEVLIEVIADSSDGATAAADLLQVSRQAGISSGNQQQPQATQSDAAAALAALAALTENTAAAAGEAAAVDIPGGVWGRQTVRELSRPERLLAAEQLTVEKRAAIRAAGVPDEAMENGSVLPALQRLGGHGPPAEVGYNRRCAHCGVLKNSFMYAGFMWNQPVHRSVCSHCEANLKCSTCPEDCSVKRPKAFSKRQGRWWGGGRRCKECIAAAEATQRAAGADRRAAQRAAGADRRAAKAAAGAGRVKTAGGAGETAAEPVGDMTEEDRAAGGAADTAGETAGDMTEEDRAAGGAADTAGETARDMTEEDEAAGGAADTAGEAAGDMTEEDEAAGGAADTADETAGDVTEEDEAAAGAADTADAAGGAAGMAEDVAAEADSADESSSVSETEEERVDADFGQTHVSTTSVVPEPERKAVEAAAELAEQERQQAFQESGGVLAGDELVFRQRSFSDEDAEVVAHRVFGGDLGGEHSFQPGSSCVVQRDWHPSTGGQVLVAGEANGAGWLRDAEGKTTPGVWSTVPQQLTRAFQVGVLGSVWCGDSEEEVDVAVDAYHWPSPVRLDHGDGWFEEDGLIGTISPHRKVRLLAIAEYARGGEMLLVEDAEEVEFDLETDFDTSLKFDYRRRDLEDDPLDEDPEDTAGCGGGCVVAMDEAYGDGMQVKRSSVWIHMESWYTHPLQ